MRRNLNLNGVMRDLKSKGIMCFSLIIFSFLLSSCAHTKGSKLYPETDYPLTRDSAYSASTSLSFRIPKGWTSAEDKDCKCIDLWLIRGDFSATINLFALENVSAALEQHPEEDTIKTVLEFSKELKKAHLKEKFKQVQEDEFFNLNKRNFGAYEYEGDEGLPVRVVVFLYKGKFFELAALPTSSVGKRAVEPKELFKVQQSILTSIN
jgi:hypothetical protein